MQNVQESKDFEQGTSPGGPTLLMRNLFPCRLVQRDGAVVGCWFAVGASAEASKADAPGTRDFYLTIVGAMRTSDDRVAGIRLTRPFDENLRLDVLREMAQAAKATDPTRIRHAGNAFVYAIDTMVSFVRRSGEMDGEAPFMLAMGQALGAALGWRPSPKDVAEASRSWAIDASAKLSRFLASLDPEALLLVERRKDLADLLGEVWPGLDRTFVPDAPLRTALGRNPSRARLVLASWPAQADQLRAAIRSDGLDTWLDRLVEATGRVRPDLLPKLAQAERAIGHAQGAGAGASGPDALSLVRRLERLPSGEHPSGDAEWRAFRDLCPVFDALATWEGLTDPVGLLLGTASCWVARRHALVEAARTHDLAQAMGRLDAMSKAYAQQVLMPAVAIARGRSPEVGPATWDAWSNAGHTVLFSRRSLSRMLETASEWALSPARAQDGNVQGSDSWAVASWPATLPDARYFRVCLQVLTDEASLYDAFAAMDRSPSDGRHRDLVSVIDRCLRGRSRVALVRVMDDDGHWHPASLVEFSLVTNPVSIADHVDRWGGRPAPDLIGAVSRYAKDLREGRIRMQEGERTLGRQPPTVRSLSGYDWRQRAGWDAAQRRWGRFLEADLRSLEPWQLSRVVGRLMRKGPRRWQGHLAVPKPGVTSDQLNAALPDPSPTPSP